MSSELVISPVSGKLIFKRVGLIVYNQKKEILLHDHREGALGWGAPAINCGLEEFPLDCIARALLDVSGILLNPNDAELVMHADINCPRWVLGCEWYVYKYSVGVDYLELRKPSWHRGIGWFDPKELRGQRAVKLEPVWSLIFRETRTITFFPEHSDLEAPD